MMCGSPCLPPILGTGLSSENHTSFSLTGILRHHPHARALLLGASESLNVVAGRVEFGEWQRLFLVELDGPRRRSLSIMAMGTLE